MAFLKKGISLVCFGNAGNENAPNRSYSYHTTWLASDLSDRSGAVWDITAIEGMRLGAQRSLKWEQPIPGSNRRIAI